VFLFLLNSSGAIILFVCLLICLSQLRLRRTTPPEKLKVKMWFYPVLTVLTAAVIVVILIQMLVKADTRSQIILSLLAWGVVLVAFAINRKAIGDAHLTEPGIAAEQQADTWMHEHGPAAELEVDAVVEGATQPRTHPPCPRGGIPQRGCVRRSPKPESLVALTSNANPTSPRKTRQSQAEG
jgi:GABA permease